MNFILKIEIIKIYILSVILFLCRRVFKKKREIKNIFIVINKFVYMEKIVIWNWWEKLIFCNKYMY